MILSMTQYPIDLGNVAHTTRKRDLEHILKYRNFFLKKIDGNEGKRSKIEKQDERNQ